MQKSSSKDDDKSQNDIENNKVFGSMFWNREQKVPTKWTRWISKSLKRKNRGKIEKNSIRKRCISGKRTIWRGFRRGIVMDYGEWIVLEWRNELIDSF